MTYSIVAEGLVKQFGTTRALDGINLEVPTGTVFGLLGPNGAGKTTAVRILATLLRPDGGHARVCGHDVVSHAHQVRQLTGLTGQYASVDESLTGLTATGVTVLLTTQYLEEADVLADLIAVVDHGAVIAPGTPDKLKARTGALTLSVRPVRPADLTAVS
jgi:ABC-type multidrug transport system ATPase subunit